MIDGAGEIMEMLRLNLDEGVSSSWHEEGSDRGKELTARFLRLEKAAIAFVFIRRMICT